MAASVIFTVAKGEAVTFAGTHQASATDATPVNIAGWTIVATVTNKDGTPLFAKTASITNAAAGQYTWSVTAADTDVASGDREIEIWRTDFGSERLMAEGKFTVKADKRNGS